MKKLLFFLLFVSFHLTTFAKNEVYLKNGSMIKGEIVEIVPNQSIKVETVDGSLFVCNYDEIEKIVRDKNETIERKTVKSSKGNTSHIKKGYRGFVTFEPILGNMYGAGITTSHGFQFNKKLFLGMGTGFRYAEEGSYEHMAIPIYLDFRFDILDYKISPFMTTRVGGCVSVNDGYSGFYASYDFGCHFKRFSFSTGIETCRGGEYDGYTTHYYHDGEWNYSYVDYVDAYQAFNFVARFSWDF